MSDSKSRVEVIIPSYNGREHLAICLPALRPQTYRDFRVILADDASTDGSCELVRELMPDAQVVRLSHNQGLVAAVNAALEQSRAELVALLNNDTEPEPGWLDGLVATIDRHPAAGAVTSKLKLFDRRDVIHSAGDTYSTAGLPGNRGVWQRDVGQFDREEEVFGACAGAALYRRAALDAVARIDGDILDPGFVMYCEDVDLSWRLRLLGYTIVYAPGAVVYHRLSATGGGRLASYYVARNTLGVIAKNLPGPLLRRYAPRIIRAQLSMTLATLPYLREPAARARLRGLLASPQLIWELRSKRRRIQAARCVPLEDIEGWLAR